MSTHDIETVLRSYLTGDGYIAADDIPVICVDIEAALQSRDREDVKRPVLDSIVDEIHRRADKEWAEDGYDFEVTITADEYKALCEEEKAIYHARHCNPGHSY